MLSMTERRLVRWALLCLVVLVNMVAVGGIVTQWVRCQPIYRAWVVGVEGRCFERATSNAVGVGVQGEFLLFSQ